MKLKLIPLSIALLSNYSNSIFADSQNTPPLQLAKSFQNEIDLSEFWISEKLDGVRAYWNGKKLITRQGNIINAPKWFIASLPKTPLDGELWIGRSKFDLVSGIIRQKVPDESEWRNVKYMIFDMPGSLKTFNNRKIELEDLVKNINSSHIQFVEQLKIPSHKELQKFLGQVTAKGGEGLMLQRGNSLYQATRSNDLQKLKLYQDAEATVVAHLPGKGKFKGMMGSILVETKRGIRFKIGSGFSHQERVSPPDIGTVITFRYRGKTSKGVPRFASFMRTRDDY